MEWWLVLLIIFCGLLALFAVGVPIAFSFLIINIIGAYVFWGGGAGLSQLILSVSDSVTKFSLLPIPLFIFLGDMMFRSGMAPKMMDVLDKWLGRLPGRLSLLAVYGGAIFGALSGAATASAAMLGKVLLPEMEKRGYKYPMSLGPIMGSAGLDIMIPPSALGVILAALGRFSVGKFLVAITIPGLLMALIYAIYIILRCRLQPSLAPLYDITRWSLAEKTKATVKYVLPLGSIFFLVMGLIFIGVATPTESAALGALGCFVLAILYRGMRWEIFKESISGTLQVTIMVFMIFTGATAFSQILAYTGTTQGLVELSVKFPLPPLVILAMMQVVLLIMGCFMEPTSIMMVTMPIFMPIANRLGFDPIWFGTIVLLNMQMATLTPPFGMILFVVKGVAPPHITMTHIYKAVYPFLGLDLIAMAIIIFYPPIVLWAPGLMH